MSGFGRWVEDFEAEARRRQEVGDPDFARRARLRPAIVRSGRRFQVGEAGARSSRSSGTTAPRCATRG
ncbi:MULTISPECIES: hypothetical protein [Saccharothrix]|uniref:hypothetical protein n=1 Tax=Saccharothrix TaxID=2071 RepID=UPI00093BFC3C|nr:hypothetical protein [Saccharothrix sp. CB00851]OKI37980.1 hypothetical protein A6A25_17805 [Saccharothrix sp. CB00851]